MNEQALPIKYGVLVRYDKELEGSIVFPDSVTKIEDNAFYGCTGLTKVVIPKRFEESVDYFFKDCPKLLEVVHC